MVVAHGFVCMLQSAWEAYRNRVIEEKLARLGVERGSQGVNIFIPGHAQARATSVCKASPSHLFAATTSYL